MLYCSAVMFGDQVQINVQQRDKKHVLIKAPPAHRHSPAGEPCFACVGRYCLILSFFLNTRRYNFNLHNQGKINFL